MNNLRTMACLILLAAGVVLTFLCATTTLADQQSGITGNAYYFFTKSLKVDDSGVACIPSRFQWSVETSFRGVDLDGNDLRDARVTLRLYDPDHNFTALTAQMDLATADKLQQQLATIVAMKRRDPTFQHRPQLYAPRDIPQKRLSGVDGSGKPNFE
jgi:hypothetical protein